MERNQMLMLAGGLAVVAVIVIIVVMMAKKPQEAPPVAAGDLPPSLPVVGPSGEPTTAGEMHPATLVSVLPPATFSWRMDNTYGHPGNDISCGRYATEAELRAACEQNKACKGYSIYNGKPWCMKHTLQTQPPESNHNYWLVTR